MRIQAIVFIHRFPFDHTLWDEIIAGGEEKYHCITYDTRGVWYFGSRYRTIYHGTFFVSKTTVPAIFGLFVIFFICVVLWLPATTKEVFWASSAYKRLHVLNLVPSVMTNVSPWCFCKKTSIFLNHLTLKFL